MSRLRAGATGVALAVTCASSTASGMAAPLAVPRHGSAAACAWRSTLAGSPSRSLLAILSPLRTPAGPPYAPSALIADLTRDHGGISGTEVYRADIRFAGVFSGRSYFFVPVHFDGCGPKPFNQAHDGVVVATATRGAFSLTGLSARGIEQGRGGDIVMSAPQRTTIGLILPDGIASVTLNYPAGPAAAIPNQKILPGVTIEAMPVRNIAFATIPRGIAHTEKPVTMTWRAANGRIIKTFNRL